MTPFDYSDLIKAVEWASEIATRTGRRQRVYRVSRRVWAIEPAAP
jgi:hypothetical protein